MTINRVSSRLYYVIVGRWVRNIQNFLVYLKISEISHEQNVLKALKSMISWPKKKN